MVFSPLVCFTHSPGRAPERLSLSTRAGSVLLSSDLAFAERAARPPCITPRSGLFRAPFRCRSSIPPRRAAASLLVRTAGAAPGWKQRLCSRITEINSFFQIFQCLLRASFKAELISSPVTPLRVQTPSLPVFASFMSSAFLEAYVMRDRHYIIRSPHSPVTSAIVCSGFASTFYSFSSGHFHLSCISFVYLHIRF